jgi:RNA polymerase sigma-70 factor (ECF subfamily)
VAEGGGEAAADFVALYRRHYPALVRALRAAGSPPDVAADLAQEAFARTLARWWRVRTGPNPGRYLYRVGFRLAARERRRRAAAAPRPAPAAPVVDLAVVSTDVSATLAAMPPRRRSVAVLCLVLEYTPTEAAAALGIRPATVRKHLELARAEVARQLGG